MNARIQAPSVAIPFQPSDFELEADAIGIALLGYPLPDWLEPRDFFSGKLRAVFEAARELGDAANLATVYAYLRDVKSGPHHPPAMSSAELFSIMDEADHSMRMGWAVDFPRLVELRKRRELLAAMRRATVLIEHDGDVCEAAEILRKAM